MLLYMASFLAQKMFSLSLLPLWRVLLLMIMAVIRTTVLQFFSSNTFQFSCKSRWMTYFTSHLSRVCWNLYVRVCCVVRAVQVLKSNFSMQISQFPQTILGRKRIFAWGYLKLLHYSNLSFIIMSSSSS